MGSDRRGSDAAYVVRLKHHLAEYRAKTLRVPAGEWGNPPREYPHILPRSEYRLNIVEPIREAFWGVHKKQRWALHRYFHHLSSSQALAFNLLFPVFPQIPASFKATRSALRLGNDAPATLDFEVVLRDGDGTNIDALIVEDRGRRSVIEIKLTEASFGRARHDPRHLDKLERTYRPLLRTHLADSVLEPIAFFRDYQLYRNLAQLRPRSDDQVILLVPRARVELWKFATSWCVRPEIGSFRGSVNVFALEDVAAALEIDARTAGHDVRPYDEVRQKYLM